MNRLAGLDAHAQRLAGTSLAALIEADPARARDFALRVGPLYANFARQRYDRIALDALFALAAEADLAGAMQRQLDGEIVNSTEGRAALHTALRGGLSLAAAGPHAQARRARERMQALVASLQASAVTDVVSVGIGGSDLGPRLVVDALAPANARLRVHFISNVDGNAARRVLAPLDPARTAAIVISKTFGTQETLLNGRIVRDWLGEGAAYHGGRLYAVSANVERAGDFGIPPERILPMWDWVGGRYSLWSAVGFPIALAIGMEAFEALLDGAAAMDAHANEAPLQENLANYLQQLVMESLGKSVRMDGSDVGLHTVPVWWGGAGTDTQHSFFQALHQGTQAVPADFIGVVRAEHGHADNHMALLANLLAQVEALANGQDADDPHRRYPGDRPSTLLLLDALTPRSLGMLVALYEHSVYLQSVLWGINAFDQFGVELGKQVASRLLPALQGEAEADDAVTRELLRELNQRR